MYQEKLELQPSFYPASKQTQTQETLNNTLRFKANTLTSPWWNWTQMAPDLFFHVSRKNKTEQNKRKRKKKKSHKMRWGKYLPAMAAVPQESRAASCLMGTACLLLTWTLRPRHAPVRDFTSCLRASRQFYDLLFLILLLFLNYWSSGIERIEHFGTSHLVYMYTNNIINWLFYCICLLFYYIFIM